MGCRDGRDGMSSDELASYKVQNELKNEIDKLTRIACNCMKFIQLTFEYRDHLDQEAVIWWDEHKKEDNRRLRREGLSKLTPDEKSALGL